MNWNHKFTHLALFSLVAITCQLTAVDDAQFRNLENRVRSLESRKGSCIVNPPARPTQKCDFGGYLAVDPLLLKAQENGLEFAAVTNSLFDGVTPESAINGHTKFKSPNFNWDWGFRLRLGANLAHDGWDLYSTWTRLYTSAHRKVDAGLGQFILPLYLSPETNAGTLFHFGAPRLALNATDHWNLHFNQLDLEVGRQFFVSKWLTLKPHVGLRGAWIHQSDKVRYFNLVNNPFTDYAVANMACKFNGIGITGGLETQWGLGCGWSLFANYAASMLYGYFHVDNDVTGVSAGVVHKFYNADNFYHVDRFINDLMVGLRYDYMFCDDEYHLGIQAGWEHHYFFGQNQFMRFVDDANPALFTANQGDLSLQGFSMQVRFDF